MVSVRLNPLEDIKLCGSKLWSMSSLCWPSTSGACSPGSSVLVPIVSSASFSPPPPRYLVVHKHLECVECVQVDYNHHNVDYLVVYLP